MELTESLVAALHDTISRDAIREVLALYCRAVDRCDAELLRACYWAEAREDRGYFSGERDTFIEWVIPQLAQLEASHHQIGSPSIALRGDRADVETYWVGYKKPKPAAGMRDQITGGRYLDEMERRDGQWRIIRRIGVADWLTTSESISMSSFALGSLILGERGPHDPVYAFPSAKAPVG
jgi:hypothetical protein